MIGAGTLVWSALAGGLSAASTQPIVSIVEGEITDFQALIALAAGVERGDGDAQITVMEFGDFQCPACQQFAALVKPQIDLAYVESGLARFVFHDYPLTRDHPHAFFAARAARCVLEQGDQYFWPFHDQLFSHQSTWALSQSPPINAFESYAGAIGADTDDFTTCLESVRYADVVSANMRLGMELGVDRTPTIFVSRGEGMAVRVVRWSEFERFQEVIDRLLEEGGAGGAD